MPRSGDAKPTFSERMGEPTPSSMTLSPSHTRTPTGTGPRDFPSFAATTAAAGGASSSSAPFYSQQQQPPLRHDATTGGGGWSPGGMHSSSATTRRPPTSHVATPGTAWYRSTTATPFGAPPRSVSGATPLDPWDRSSAGDSAGHHHHHHPGGGADSEPEAFPSFQAPIVVTEPFSLTATTSNNTAAARMGQSYQHGGRVSSTPTSHHHASALSSGMSSALPPLSVRSLSSHRNQGGGEKSSPSPPPSRGHSFALAPLPTPLAASSSKAAQQQDFLMKVDTFRRVEPLAPNEAGYRSNVVLVSDIMEDLGHHSSNNEPVIGSSSSSSQTKQSTAESWGAWMGRLLSKVLIPQAGRNEDRALAAYDEDPSAVRSRSPHATMEEVDDPVRIVQERHAKREARRARRAAARRGDVSGSFNAHTGGGGGGGSQLLRHSQPLASFRNVKNYDFELESDDGIIAPSPNRSGYHAQQSRADRWVGNDVQDEVQLEASCGAGGAGKEEEGHGVNLTAAFELYKDVPNEFFGSLVQAALAQRDIHFSPVTGEELALAQGCPTLIVMCIRSGCLNLRDPLVTSVIQQEIDDVIVSRREVALRSRPTEEQQQQASHNSSIASALVPHQGNDSRVDASIVTYLRSLFLLPTSRLSTKQVRLLERSGFEFLVLLADFPHVTKHAKGRVLGSLLRHPLIDLVAVCCGLALMVLDFSLLLTLLVEWWNSARHIEFAYYTLWVALGGYFAQLVAVFILATVKADISLYGEERDAFQWDFPSPTLKIFPFAPLYEVILAYTLLRYEIRSRSEAMKLTWKPTAAVASPLRTNPTSSDSMDGAARETSPMSETITGSSHAAQVQPSSTRYMAIKHDLYATFFNMFLLFCQASTFPQILLQMYCVRWGAFRYTKTLYSWYVFQMFIAVASTSVVLSAVMWFRRQLLGLSVNRAGYAVFGRDPKGVFLDDGDDQRDVEADVNEIEPPAVDHLPADACPAVRFASTYVLAPTLATYPFFPRMLTFLLSYLLIYNCFFLVIATVQISNCETDVVVWVCIMGALVVSATILLVLSLCSGESVRVTGMLSALPLLGQIAFSIYSQSIDRTTQSEQCAFYSLTLGGNVTVGIAAFSVMLAVWVAWIVAVLLLRYRTGVAPYYDAVRANAVEIAGTSSVHSTTPTSLKVLMLKRSLWYLLRGK